jgi:hypothetical protein
VLMPSTDPRRCSNSVSLVRMIRNARSSSLSVGWEACVGEGAGVGADAEVEADAAEVEAGVEEGGELAATCERGTAADSGVGGNGVAGSSAAGIPCEFVGSAFAGSDEGSLMLFVGDPLDRGGEGRGSAKRTLFPGESALAVDELRWSNPSGVGVCGVRRCLTTGEGEGADVRRTRSCRTDVWV